MRKLGIVVIIVVAILVAIVVVVPLVLDVNRYHGLVQGQLEKALGRPVSFGQMHLSLTPPSVRLDNVVIGEAPGFGSGQFASTHYIDASVKLLPLIRGEVEIRSLKLQQPTLQLIRNARGVWNFSSLGGNKEPSKQGGETVVLQNLKIAGGQVTLVDETKRFRGVYNNIDATVNGYAPGKAFDLTLALHLPGPGQELAQLSGTAGPIASDDALKTPFNGKLELKEVSLSGIQKVANVPALEGMDGMASGTVSARNENGVFSSDGSLQLKDGVVRGVKIDYPITLDYNIKDELARDFIQINSGKLLLGQTPLHVSGSVDAGATPTKLDLKLQAKNASIEEAARLASAFGVAFNPGMKVNGGVDADLRAQGPSNAPELNGTLNAKDLRISGGELKQPVDVTAMTLTMTPREIRSNPFTASSGGSKVAVQFALTNYTSPSPLVDATVRTANAQVQEIIAIANAYGVSAAQGMSGSGALDLDVRVTGPMKNTSALNFAGSGRLQNASLKTPDLTQPLNVRNADLRFTSNSMTVQNLAASLGHTNAGGTLTARNFAAPQVQFTLTADRLNITELQQMVVSQPPAKRAAFSLVPRAEAAPARVEATPSLLNKTTGNGTISIGSVEQEQLVLQNVKSNVTLDHGVIRLAPLTASLYGGQQSGAITLDTRTTPMGVVVSSNLQQVDANQLLSATTSLKQTLYGLLTANANTTFRATSANDIARTLNGTLNLNLVKGRLAHVDILNQLASIGRFVQGAAPAAAQPFTDIVQLAGTFNVVNGLAQTNNLKAVIPGASLAADGAVNLASEALDMHLTAVLSKEMSQKAGGTGIGGFMNTALANKNGELVIPVLVTGTFSSPRFAPDVQKLAQMKLQNVLPTAANPGGILGAVLGRGQNQQGGKQQGGLGGILGALGGQQQQQPPPQQGNQPVANPQQNPPPQAQPQQQNPLGDLLGQVLNKKKKPPQPQPPPAQQPPPPPPPK